MARCHRRYCRYGGGIVSASASQIALMHHTLGLSVENRTPYRNHFVAGAGHHDMPDLDALVGLGFMARSPTPKFCNDSDIVFHVTEAGKAVAIELLPQEPERTRYEEFLRADCGDSFGEFLCGHRLPKVETETAYRAVDGRYRYIHRHRMYRLEASSQWRREVEGEWCSTKKEAKASYKAALASHNATQGAAP
jgi:hypothetical protein